MFPVNNSLFFLLLLLKPVFVSSLPIIRHTPSRWMWPTGWTCPCPLSLSYWTRWWWDWPPWTETPPSCEEWGRPLTATSCRLRLLLGAGACRRGRKRRGRGWGQGGGGGGREAEGEKIKEMVVGLKVVPLPPLWSTLFGGPHGPLSPPLCRPPSCVCAFYQRSGFLTFRSNRSTRPRRGERNFCLYSTQMWRRRRQLSEQNRTEAKRTRCSTRRFKLQSEEDVLLVWTGIY